jgi:AcrR family transcriptional regulator
MNSRPEFNVAASSPALPPTRMGVRAAGKARSRQNLLSAAKRLFMERGYDGATVRDIAAAAGLSTGAVFASFSDKADLFNEVLLTDIAVQTEAMRQAASEDGLIDERLLKLLTVGYRHQLSQVELLRAALAVSWSQGLRGELGDRPIRRAVMDQIRDVLQAAVAKAELRHDADVDLISETVWDCYVRNYRHALFEGWGLEQLVELMGRQVELLLAGQRPA